MSRSCIYCGSEVADEWPVCCGEAHTETEEERDEREAAAPINEKAAPVVLPVDLRDYFAAKALHASLSLDPAQAASAEEHSRWAYEYADAMLAARSKT